MMKRLLLFFLVFALLVLPLSGCGKKADDHIDIALIVAQLNVIESNFYALLWNGIEQYCKDEGLKCAYYEPTSVNDFDFASLVKRAVDQGADILIMPGYLLANASYEAQAAYPDVRFITIDDLPNNGVEGEGFKEVVGDNTLSLIYAEEQAGYLAGYAAVMDGYRELGFFGGMSVPAVMRFGYGFIQGAEHAGEMLGLADDEIMLKYLYCGTFFPSPELQSMASKWYTQGTEIIFVCGGGIDQSVFKAAEATGRAVIGVDTDQSGDSETVVTSAMKLLKETIYESLKGIRAGTIKTGQTMRLGVLENGVGIAMDTSRLKNFTQDNYTAVLEELKNDVNGARSGILIDDKKLSDIPVRCVNIIEESLR